MSSRRRLHAVLLLGPLSRAVTSGTRSGPWLGLRVRPPRPRVPCSPAIFAVFPRDAALPLVSRAVFTPRFSPCPVGQLAHGLYRRNRGTDTCALGDAALRPPAGRPEEDEAILSLAGFPSPVWLRWGQPSFRLPWRQTLVSCPFLSKLLRSRAGPRSAASVRWSPGRVWPLRF